MGPQELSQAIHPHMHSPQAQLPVDPSLQVYYPAYNIFQQEQSQPLPQRAVKAQLNIPGLSPQASSPHTPEYMSTPPDEAIASPDQSNPIAKRSSSSSIHNGITKHRKKPKRDDKDEDVLSSPSVENGAEGKAKATRGSRACTVCRRLKMKCVGAEDGPPCKRCQQGHHQCIFEESNRGKRSVNNVRKHEQLTRSLRKMEKTLDTVLKSIGNPGLGQLATGIMSRSPSPGSAGKKPVMLEISVPQQGGNAQSSQRQLGSPRLNSLPDNELNPLGLLAEASLANRRAQSHSHASMNEAISSSEANRKVGVANDVYFKPGPMSILPLRRLFIERQVQPEMLNFVSTDEVVSLFKIFFDCMNIHIGLMDPGFHTPSLVCSRSPFLLTTICAISSKFYNVRPELHPKLTNLSRKLAFSVPEQGYKSVEIVQAYLLLALWGCGPVERYEMDKTWLLLGMGIRTAIDLNLHRKTSPSGLDTPEGRARDREIQNRERTWFICFILDRSMSAQMGKPHSIKEGFIIQNTSQFWTKPTSANSDRGIAAYAELQRILSRGLDLLYSGTTSPSGLQVNCDYYLVIGTLEAQIRGWLDEWLTPLVNEGGTIPSRLRLYWSFIGKFYYNYALLVISSFGLQNALERSPTDIGYFFAKCHSAAVACATIARDELGPNGFLRYSPDTHFVQISYAVLSLLKFTRPIFRPFLNDERKTFQLIRNIADLLENIAAGPLHTPALYATFLRALITVRTEEPRNCSPGPSSTRKQEQTEETFAGIDEDGSRGDQGSSIDPNNSMPIAISCDNVAASPAFQFINSEMGPVADISTFPPTMAPNEPQNDVSEFFSMDSILSTNFWDSVLVPGYSNSLEGLSGGFVYGAGGSGIITPRIASPEASGSNTPMVDCHEEGLSESVQTVLQAEN